MAAGSGFTVTVTVRAQPVGNVNDTTEVPTATEVTTPVDEPMVATAVLTLLQVPVPASVRVVPPPRHIEAVPLIVPGIGLTVSEATCMQPVAGIV
jgi:hypothetical protein